MVGKSTYPRKLKMPPKDAYPTLEAWFWSGVEHDPVTGCDVWKGAYHHQGYGYFMLDGKQKLAHVYAMELRIGGPIPSGKQVNHHCDNRPCITHTYVGTQRQNIADMDRRGRRACLPSPNRTFSPEQVRAIRARYKAGGVRHQDFAAEYGVSTTVIGHLIRGKTYKDC